MNGKAAVEAAVECWPGAALFGDGDAETFATMPARTAFGRSGHDATPTANSESLGFVSPDESPLGARELPDLLPPESEPRAFPADNRNGSSTFGVLPLPAEPLG